MRRHKTGQTEGFSTKQLINNFPVFQDHERQGKMEELSKTIELKWILLNVLWDPGLESETEKRH